MKLIRVLRMLFAVLLGLAVTTGAYAAPAPRQKRVLLFTHTTGYRHASIDPGSEAIIKLGKAQHISVVRTEDPDVFSTSGLKAYDAIIFLSTTTDPKKLESEWFEGDRRTALQAFVHRGGGIVGIHGASDSHYGWPWYQRMIGGHFARHPQGTPTGTVKVVDRLHPSTRGLPAKMTRTDEWYYFDDYNPEMNLLITLDPQSIGEKDANPNPVSWSHNFEGGRVFYTAMGHTNECFIDANFLKHLAGGLNWVLRR
ncbi:MAG: ThuA domain-containing protein [Sphingomicrobium sp.]